jgi:hypothetical protein
MCALGVGPAVALVNRKKHRGGKSGLHRVERQVTPGRCEPTESATESRPPKRKVRKQTSAGKGERVR